MSQTLEPLYVNQQDAARLLSITPQHLRDLEKEGKIDKPSRDGRLVRYEVANLKAYMKSIRS